MTRVLIGSLCFVLVGFAPAPMLFNRPSQDNSERLLARFEKDVQQEAPDQRELIAARKAALMAMLEQRHAELRRFGRDAQANALYERLILLETVDADRPLGKFQTRPLLRKASSNGKYRHLLRVIYVPADQRAGEVQDYGFWNGSTYGGATDIPPGYWVYIAPRWFIWSEPVESSK